MFKLFYPHSNISDSGQAKEVSEVKFRKRLGQEFLKGECSSHDRLVQ